MNFTKMHPILPTGSQNASNSTSRFPQFIWFHHTCGSRIHVNCLPFILTYCQISAEIPLHIVMQLETIQKQTVYLLINQVVIVEMCDTSWWTSETAQTLHWQQGATHIDVYDAVITNLHFVVLIQPDERRQADRRRVRRAWCVALNLPTDHRHLLGKTDRNHTASAMICTLIQV
jgi:hypothetical protein